MGGWRKSAIGVAKSGTIFFTHTQPTLERARNVVPLPRGRYRIGPARTHATKDPVTMNLDPSGHIAHGRTAFLIHGG